MERINFHRKGSWGTYKLFARHSSFYAFSRYFLILLLLTTITVTAQNTNIDNLRVSLQNGDSEAKRTALFQLRNIQSAEASRIAIVALADKDEIVRATAAGSVVFAPGIEAAPALLPLLSDKAVIVRREAASALGELRDTSAVQPLTALLQKDKIIEVKGAAAMALGKIGDPSAVEALSKILKTAPKDDNEFLRRSAARSVGQIAQFIQTGHIDTLVPQNFLPEKFKRIEAPKYRDLKTEVPAFRDTASQLLKVLQDSKESDDTRREAAYALGTIGDASATPALQAYLSSPDNYLAEVCREALLRLRQ